MIEWPFYCVRRKNIDRTSKRPSRVPMCRSILHAVRFALIPRGEHFTHFSAAPLKISQLGGLLNISR